MTKKTYSFIILSLLISGFCGYLHAESPLVRVQISDSPPEIFIYAKIFSIFGISDKTQNTVKNTLLSRNRALFAVGKDGLKLDGKETGWQTAKLASSDGPIWVNGKAFSGDVFVTSSSDGKAHAVNQLPLETYLEGILAGEIPQSWPVEALKAQAVAARSYALSTSREKQANNNSGHFDLKSTIEDQVYAGSVPVNKKILEAVEKTAGEIIAFDDKPVKARFHSTCGGHTEISNRVWGDNDASKSVADPYCKGSPYANWQITLSGDDIAQILKKYEFDTGNILTIECEYHDDSQRIAAVSIHGNKQTLSFTGNNFRRHLGFNKIKSSLFSVSKNGNNFTFKGRGFGHGVGMCQWGAKGMAEKGYSYRDILNFYYPGTEVKKVY